MRIASTGVVNDSGQPEQVPCSPRQHTVEELPDECLLFLLGSRYCETDRLSNTAWTCSKVPTGALRVRAILRLVHHHAGYAEARATKTAWEVFNEKQASAETTRT
jgi:hypothetical protein